MQQLSKIGPIIIISTNRGDFSSVPGKKSGIVSISTDFHQILKGYKYVRWGLFRVIHTAYF